MARKKKVDLPSQGDAFAVPLADGRYSVCRVILDSHSGAAKKWKTPCVLVACSAWISDKIPSAADPGVRPILHPTHHSWEGEPKLAWISVAVLPDFIPIGRIEPTAEETAIDCGTFANWSSMSIQPLLQWRWDNERDSVLREDEKKKAEATDRQTAAADQRKAYLASVRLDDLLNHEFFPRWKDYPSRRAIRESRNAMATTVRGLIDVGGSATKEQRSAILQSCIESFNRLDEELHFIETVEREDICDEFEVIVHACGLGNHENLADRWREW
jgi:hypothetical protein